MTTYLNIKGMHCDACVKLITSELKDVPGITGSSIDPASGKGSIISTGKAAAAELVAAVKRAGYEATVEREENDEEKPADFTVKIRTAASGKPMKLTLTSTVEATGSLTEDTLGNHHFDGKIKAKRDAEFVLPKTELLGASVGGSDCKLRKRGKFSPC